VHKALTILAGCPDGATYHALKVNGIRDAEIMMLEQQHLVRIAEQDCGCNALRFKVTRYWINDKGRKRLSQNGNGK
jgi:hypothetical protein